MATQPQAQTKNARPAWTGLAPYENPESFGDIPVATYSQDELSRVKARQNRPISMGLMGALLGGVLGAGIGDATGGGVGRGALLGAALGGLGGVGLNAATLPQRQAVFQANQAQRLANNQQYATQSQLYQQQLEDMTRLTGGAVKAPNLAQAKLPLSLQKDYVNDYLPINQRYATRRENQLGGIAAEQTFQSGWNQVNPPEPPALLGQPATKFQVLAKGAKTKNGTYQNIPTMGMAPRSQAAGVQQTTVPDLDINDPYSALTPAQRIDAKKEGAKAGTYPSEINRNNAGAAASMSQVPLNQARTGEATASAKLTEIRVKKEAQLIDSQIYRNLHSGGGGSQKPTALQEADRYFGQLEKDGFIDAEDRAGLMAAKVSGTAKNVTYKLYKAKQYDFGRDPRTGRYYVLINGRPTKPQQGVHYEVRTIGAEAM